MTGPAWDRLVASTRTSEHGAQVYRDAYEAGRSDALCIPLDAPAYDPRRMQAAALAMGEKRGAWGRGSRARYRRAVVEAIRRWSFYDHMDPAQLVGDGWWDRRARSCRAAARRARAILQRLDKSEP